MPEDDLPDRSIGRLGVQRTTWQDVQRAALLMRKAKIDASS